MKVGRFGLGFKSVFHMTGKAKYHQSTCELKMKIIFCRFFFISKLQKNDDQSSATSAM